MPSVLSRDVPGRLIGKLFFSQQIGELKKENFNLKLRIYFLEERLQQKLGDGEDVFRTVSFADIVIKGWSILELDKSFLEAFTCRLITRRLIAL